MTERHYRIVRSSWGVVYVEDVNPAVDVDGKPPLEVPHQILHSPSGMEYGYEGSGPSDLARSILVYHTGSFGVGPQVYQQFKREFIATLDGGQTQHTIPWQEVQAWLDRKTSK